MCKTYNTFKAFGCVGTALSDTTGGGKPPEELLLLLEATMKGFNVRGGEGPNVRKGLQCFCIDNKLHCPDRHIAVGFRCAEADTRLPNPTEGKLREDSVNP